MFSGVCGSTGFTKNVEVNMGSRISSEYSYVAKDINVDELKKSNSPTMFETQNEFDKAFDDQIRTLRESALIDQDSENSLRESSSPSSNDFVSFSNPNSAIVLAMLNTAQKTQSVVDVEIVDFANNKKVLTINLAEDKKQSAWISFGMTAGAGLGSLATGYCLGNSFNKQSKKVDMTAEPETANWGPQLTNMTFQTSTSLVQATSETYAYDHTKQQSEIDRADSTVESLKMMLNQINSQAERLKPKV